MSPFGYATPALRASFSPCSDAINGQETFPFRAWQAHTSLSPYGTSTTKRFGSFHLDLKKPPEPWLRESQFRQAAKQARAASDKMKDNTTPTKGKRGKK